MEKSRTYSGSFYEGEGLTYEKLRETLDGLPKIEFTAFTVSWRGKSLLAQQVKTSEEFADVPTAGAFHGLNVYVVAEQINDFIQWTDKDALDTYLQMMGERTVKQQVRLEVLKKLATLSSLPWCKIVTNTISVPTVRLVAALPYVEQIALSSIVQKERENIYAGEFGEAFRESLKKLEIHIQRGKERYKKSKKQKSQPRFYDKFTRSKRR